MDRDGVIVIVWFAGLILFCLALHALSWRADHPRCKKCGKRGRETQTKFGYKRKYKCNHCGNIRKEQGLDY